jgi:phosphate transport system substrate-binding protein
VAVSASIALSATACGGTFGIGASEDGHDGGDRVGAGDIEIAGSSTMEPISAAVVESYRSVDPDLPMSVVASGTGEGFRAYCAGETDIAPASRTITDAEALVCATDEIPFVELTVAHDGIVVVTDEDNPVECLSFADLYALVGPESSDVVTWADAVGLAGELGSATELPVDDLRVAGPAPGSGTHDRFVELVIEDLAVSRNQPVETATVANDASDATAGGRSIVEAVSSASANLGWVGFGVASEADGVALVAISEEPGGPCVAPTPETIASRSYPLARDLFLYVNTFHATNDPAMVDFVDHYMDVGLDEAVGAAGYVPLTDGDKAATRAAWDASIDRSEG